MAVQEYQDGYGYNQEAPSRYDEYDQWGRPPGDPWYGIPPGYGGQSPYAPGQFPDPPDPKSNPDPSDTPTPPPPPPTTPTPSGSGGMMPMSALASFNGPRFHAPPPFAYQDFQYDGFTAPTLDDARQEPGFEFAMEQGRKQLENSAAARGTLRTGGTLKDLFAWGNKFGEQNYGNVFNRAKDVYGVNRGNAFENYTTNRSNAADTYATNYGVSRDTFDRDYRGAFDTYNFDYQKATADFNRQWEEYMADQDLALAGQN